MIIVPASIPYVPLQIEVINSVAIHHYMYIHNERIFIMFIENAHA